MTFGGWFIDSCWPKKPFIRWGSRSPTGTGNFGIEAKCTRSRPRFRNHVWKVQDYEWQTISQRGVVMIAWPICKFWHPVMWWRSVENIWGQKHRRDGEEFSRGCPAPHHPHIIGSQREPWPPSLTLGVSWPLTPRLRRHCNYAVLYKTATQLYYSLNWLKHGASTSFCDSSASCFNEASSAAVFAVRVSPSRTAAQSACMNYTLTTAYTNKLHRVSKRCRCCLETCNTVNCSH